MIGRRFAVVLAAGVLAGCAHPIDLALYEKFAGEVPGHVDGEPPIRLERLAPLAFGVPHNLTPCIVTKTAITNPILVLEFPRDIALPAAPEQHGWQRHYLTNTIQLTYRLAIEIPPHTCISPAFPAQFVPDRNFTIRYFVVAREGATAYRSIAVEVRR